MKLSLSVFFFLCVCISVSRSISARVRGCMISPGDRILRACNNCRANANAWLVALHQLVRDSEVVRGAARRLALGRHQKSPPRPGLFCPPAFDIRLCRASRMHISCSTTAFHKYANEAHDADGEKLAPWSLSVLFCVKCLFSTWFYKHLFSKCNSFLK